MIQLTNVAGTAPDKLQLITSAVCDVHVHASWVNLAGTTVVPGRTNTAITTQTTTDISPTPASGEYRRVKLIQVRNRHATSPVDVTVVYDANGTDTELVKVTLNAGEALTYTEGVGWQLIAAASTGGFGDILERVIDADQTGTDVATAQPWFPTLGAVNVEAGVVYEIDGRLHTTRAAGAVSHTTGLLFAGTASLTYINYTVVTNTTDVVTIATPSRVSSLVATNVTVKAASTSATEAISLKVDGYVKINAAGTFIPQFIYSAAPGGVPTIKTGSHFRLVKKGAAYNQRGVWA